MRESGFTESQIVAILKEGEAGVALSELTRKHGISRATYFNWQAKYGGVSVSELKRMKGLESLDRAGERWLGNVAAPCRLGLIQRLANRQEITDLVHFHGMAFATP
jgi:putative transposase